MIKIIKEVEDIKEFQLEGGIPMGFLNLAILMGLVLGTQVVINIHLENKLNKEMNKLILRKRENLMIIDSFNNKV